jgi:hypothetical protein
MDINVLHKVEIVPLENQHFKFMAQCSCGHQSRTMTEDGAKFAKDTHLQIHAAKATGMTV